MRKKVNIKIPSVNDDSDRTSQYLAGDKSFQENARRFSEKSVHDQIVKKYSEFKRPYDGSENYQEMEALGDLPPGFNPYSFALPDIPGIDWQNPDFGDLYNPWHLVFHCNPDLCWCEGETRCAYAGCTHEIVRVEFDSNEPNFKLTYTKTRICIEALAGAYGSPDITITMKANVPEGGSLWKRKYKVVKGRHQSIGISPCRTSKCCDGTTPVVWATSWGSTIARSNTLGISVTGTGSPFTWAVSGTGFSLDYATTVGLNNTLNADGTACGKAMITVTDCDGNSDIGYVACTTGSWALDGGSCAGSPNLASCLCNLCSSGAVDIYIGSSHQLVVSYKGSNSGWNCTDCVDPNGYNCTFSDGFSPTMYEVFHLGNRAGNPPPAVVDACIECMCWGTGTRWKWQC